MKWVCWVWVEKGQLKLCGADCWVGWGCCLFGEKVWTEKAAAAAVVDWEVAVVQVDADVAAPRC